MAKFLFLASFTAEGKKGLLKEGGTKRKATIAKLAADAGGKLESFYYAFGESDACMIVDLPDAITAAALSMNAGASGAVQVRTVPLMTPEDFDVACGRSVDYKRPGA